MPVAIPLVELSVLALTLLCLALALLIVKIMTKIGDVLAATPVVGGYLGRQVHSLAQAISSALGSAERGIDAAIGASWHALARLSDEGLHLLERYAEGNLHAAELLLKLLYAHSGLKALVHRIEAALHGIEHGVKDLRREWRGIEHRVGRIERDIARGIGNDVRGALRDLRKEVKGVEGAVTTDLPKAIDYAEGLTASLGRFIGVTPGTSYLEWAKGLALAGLAALGLKGLACENNPLKNQDCSSNVWGNLESLLGLAASVLVAAEFTELVKEMQGLESGAAAVFKDAVGLG